MDESIKKVLEQPVKRSFLTAVKQLAGQNVLLYGAGSFGIEMLHHFRAAGVRPAAFLDQNAVTICARDGLPVYTAEGAPFRRNESVVIFCIVMDFSQRKAVLSWLRQLGYHAILEGQALRVLLVQPDDYFEETLAEYYRSRFDTIESVESLFEEPHSRTLYAQTIYAHASCDYSGCERLESPMEEQYFPSDILLSKGFNRFVDCGGYTGDTIQRLLDQVGSIDACAVFEPDSSNYIRMARNISRIRERINQRWLFPCAVSDGAERRQFTAGTGSGALSSGGSETVQTVSLDLAIPDFHPTTIKMDIEGAEYSALQGAREIIAQDKPDLEICTYHAVNHIWGIPKLLHSWSLGYHFYLRNYNACTMETVLYASVR